MTPAPKHTPTPYKQEWEGKAVLGASGEYVAQCQKETGVDPVANAAFIVLACNNHDKLVEALEDVRENLKYMVVINHENKNLKATLLRKISAALEGE